ncbi:MAG: hypothetical protein V4563_17865 [Pseudomonadota bacterium]
MSQRIFHGSGKWVEATPEDVWEETRRAYGSFTYNPDRRNKKAELRSNIKALRDDGYTVKETAEKLGKCVASVRYHDHRSRL